MKAANQQKKILFINDGMTKNVVATIINFFICCFSYGISLSLFGFIAGLIGIYHSNQVKTMQMMDSEIGAQSSASNANLWGNISLGILVFNLFLVLLFIILYGVSMFAVLYDDLYY